MVPKPKDVTSESGESGGGSSTELHKGENLFFKVYF